MSPLIDTDICIYWLKGHHAVKARFESLDSDGVTISVITAAELLFGAYNSDREEEMTRTRLFISLCEVRPLSDDVIHFFGEWKSKLRKRGERIEDFYLLIACTALAEGRVLVTNNLKHYIRVDGLAIDNWLESEGRD